MGCGCYERSVCAQACGAVEPERETVRLAVCENGVCFAHARAKRPDDFAWAMFLVFHNRCNGNANSRLGENRLGGFFMGFPSIYHNGSRIRPFGMRKSS